MGGRGSADPSGGERRPARSSGGAGRAWWRGGPVRGGEVRERQRRVQGDSGVGRKETTVWSEGRDDG